MQPAERLKQGLAQMQLDLSDEIQAKLLAYLLLMQKWNKAYNLTAIRDLDQMVIRHLLDSLSILPFITESPILDVGTGAGLPGIPLALCLTDKKFILLDSNSKKTRFLTQAKIELGIDNMEVIHSRIEDYQPGFGIEIITCRAFAALNTILDSTQHLVTSTTRILAMKGKEEIPSLLTGFEQVISHDLNVAWLDEERHLIEIKKS
ncbi:MAG: 16S rRNA (guanine(527)-N(7))-methyltransferase RsmG [Gammaproteobacteria bacterium]|nr:16S rRNA (guanine(527)-N(7))-methyltransferase RsmG [Gammaproteobacteria bacterium]